jgi:hypothetical protein
MHAQHGETGGVAERSALYAARLVDKDCRSRPHALAAYQRGASPSDPARQEEYSATALGTSALLTATTQT